MSGNISLILFLSFSIASILWSRWFLIVESGTLCENIKFKNDIEAMMMMKVNEEFKKKKDLDKNLEIYSKKFIDFSMVDNQN